MIKNISQMLVVALVLRLAQPLCFAQSDSWERIKLIEAGKAISVTLRSGKPVNGKMHAWSIDGLTVAQRRNLVNVKRAEIEKVALVAGMSRGRRAAWAGLIGGGAGAALGAAACASSGDCDMSPAALAAGSAVWIGGIAAVIAALIPQHKETIYRAPSGTVKNATGTTRLSSDDHRTSVSERLRVCSSK